MPKTLIKSRFIYNEPERKPKMQNTTSSLHPNLNTIRGEFLPGNGFIVYKAALKISNDPMNCQLIVQ